MKWISSTVDLKKQSSQFSGNFGVCITMRQDDDGTIEGTHVVLKDR
jgi:hypothetical protein